MGLSVAPSGSDSSLGRPAGRGGFGAPGRAAVVGPSGSPGGGEGTRSNSLMSESSSSQPDVHPFFKEQAGRYVVLYSYQAQDENDLSVERGQCVTVLNSDDPDWYWVARYDQCEGFVPSGFIYPLDAIQRQRESLECSFPV